MYSSSQPESEPSVHFYCAQATGETTCKPCKRAGESCAAVAFRSPSTYSSIYIEIANHANGGERCRLYAGDFEYQWHDIDYGDNSPTELGTLGTELTFNLRCQRRAGSGDASIGGHIYARYSWDYAPQN